MNYLVVSLVVLLCVAVIVSGYLIYTFKKELDASSKYHLDQFRNRNRRPGA